MREYDYDYDDDRIDYAQQALDDESVPPALKDLYRTVIPQKDIATFREMVADGRITPLMGSGDVPLMSPLSQIMAMDREDTIVWLDALFAKNTALIKKATVPGWNMRWGFQSALKEYEEEEDIERPLLLQVLSPDDKADIVDIATLSVALLSEKMADREGKLSEENLFHYTFDNYNRTVETLDRLEKIAGNADFLSIKNKRGQTLFHALASNSNWTENESKLDLASWMLQRNPRLVNEPDRFGWTPLDRLLSSTQGKTDNSMGRLLLASGARLEKQIAPSFNLAAVLQEEEKRLDKSPVRPLPGLKPKN